MSERVAVFFDIGDTLGSAIVEGSRLTRIDVFPFVPEILGRLRAGVADVAVSVGVISNTGNESMSRLSALMAGAGLSGLVDDDLCLFSSVERLDKTQPAFFDLARERAALPADRCVFVGENADERVVAASVGFLVSPHPLHALHLVETAFFASQVNS